MTRSVTARWATTRYLLGQLLPFVLLVWLGVVALVAVLAVGYSFFGDVTRSGWDIAMQVARWFAAGIGGYVTYALLPSHVAYGQTRRAFLRQTVPFALVAVTLLAALAALGFLLEGVLYRLMGWSQAVDAGRVFAAPDQAGLVVVAFWVQFAAWMVAGALVAVAGYREDGSMLIAIPVAVLTIVGAGLAVGLNGVPFADRFIGAFALPSWIAVALWAASCLLAAALTWLIGRDLPLRSRPA